MRNPHRSLTCSKWRQQVSRSAQRRDRLINVTALSPYCFEGVPAAQLPAEGGVAGVLLVDTDDGRRFGLVQEDLLEALIFLAAGSAVIDEHDVLSFDQFDADDGQLSLQLRVGSRGEEIASWVCNRQQLQHSIRRCWAVVEDASYAWGDAQLQFDLHDPGGKWTRHMLAAQNAASRCELEPRERQHRS